MQVARYELVPLFQACVCELRAGHVRKIIGFVWTKVFNIYSKSNGKMVHWRFLPFFPNDGAPERGSWVLFLRLRGHFSAFPFFSGTEACWRSTFPRLFVEDGDGGVLMGHVFRAFCARWIEVLWALWRFARDWLFLLRILNTVVLRVHKAI